MNRAGRRCIPPKRFLNAIVAAGCLACATVPALPETGPAVIAIDQMTSGAPPTGFVFARTGRGGQAAWRVVDDKTATAGRAI